MSVVFGFVAGFITTTVAWFGWLFWTADKELREW